MLQHAIAGRGTHSARPAPTTRRIFIFSLPGTHRIHLIAVAPSSRFPPPQGLDEAIKHGYTIKFYNDEIAPERVESVLAEEVTLPQAGSESMKPR